MNRCRLLSTLFVIALGCQSCNLPKPTAEMNTAQVTFSPTSPLPLSIATDSVTRTPTSTPQPLGQIVGISDGATIAAQQYTESKFPYATLTLNVTDREQKITLDADGILVSRHDMLYTPGIEELHMNWIPWHGNGEYRLDITMFNYRGRVIEEQSITVFVEGIPPETPTIQDTIINLYRQYFNLALTHPIILHYSDPDPERSAWNQWVSVAYIDDRYYYLYLYDESGVSGHYSNSLNSGVNGVCRPRGEYKVLTLVVDYGNTGVDPAAAVEELEDAAEAANRRWAEYSTSIGMEMPILQIETTTVFLGAPPTPGDFTSVDVLESLTGYDPSQFDIIAQVDLDYNATAVWQYGTRGGIALYGGCVQGGPTHVNMGLAITYQNHLDSVGGALYEHELTHLFGWSHLWPDGDGSGIAQLNKGLWFPYSLFGWVDADGDGIPEILDSTPYGMMP